MTSENEMAAYTVGELRPLNSEIRIVDYNPTWPTLFECEAQRIRTALGNEVVRLEHVGSTSVPDLAAKPCIDIVLAVRDSSDEPSYAPRLEAAGYVLRIREPNWNEHRMFKGSDVGVNLHVFSAGCSEINHMIAFRDWLRSNCADRELYEETKRNLAVRQWKYVQNYADAKSAIVTEILGRALSVVPERNPTQ